MRDRAVDISPQDYARIGGLLYLYIIVAGVITEIFGRNSLIVSGDAAATAHNIAAHESLVRVSLAAHVSWLLCAVAISVILYALLRPVNKTLALFATLFNVVSIAIEAVAVTSLFAGLFFLGDAAYLKSFEPNQLHALAYLADRVYNYAFGVSLVFFGCCLFFYGYLIIKSGYFPKTIGVLLIIAGLCYLANSFVLFIAPAYANTVFPILVLAFIGELSFCLWLIVKGVDVPKWEASLTRRSDTG